MLTFKFDKLKIDDPVGAHAVHGIGGIWGVVAVGLFGQSVPLSDTYSRAGLFMGGGWYLLGVQCLAALCLFMWGAISTFVLLFLVDKISPLRMSEGDEILGADLIEHNIQPMVCTCSESAENIKKIKMFDEKPGGEDNFGYHGKFTLKNLELARSRTAVVAPPQNNHESA